MAVVAWPKERRSEGLGLSIKDGWNFAIGFWLFASIALPIIMLLLACLIAFGIAMIGSEIGALL